MLLSGDFKFLGLKHGETSGKKWHLLQLKDNKGYHANFFVKDPKRFENLKNDDNVKINLELFYFSKKKQYYIRVVD